MTLSDKLAPAKNLTRTVLRPLRTENTNYMFWVGRDDEGPNFGDLIGPYLYEKVTGRQPTFMHPSNRSLKTVYLTVGSILYWCRDNAMVWGSGIVRKDETFPQPHKTYSVRGPLTRQRFMELGYSCPEKFGDPGLLMSTFYRPDAINKRYKLGIIPHYVDQGACAELYPASADIKVINVYDPVEKVIDQILSCEAIVSSSLHGLIMAHAYGIPAGWIKFGDRLWGDNVKFADHYKSLQGDIEPHALDVEQYIDLSALIAFVSDSFQPNPSDVSVLQNSLLESCPFKA